MYETARMPSFRAFRSDQFMNLHRFGGLSLLRNDLLNKCEFSLFSICSVCFRRHDHENVRFLLKITLSVTVQSGFIWKDENALVITGKMSRIRQNSKGFTYIFVGGCLFFSLSLCFPRHLRHFIEHWRTISYRITEV